MNAPTTNLFVCRFDLVNVDLAPYDHDYMDVDQKPRVALPTLPRPSTFLRSSGSAIHQKPLALSAAILHRAATDLEAVAPWSQRLSQQRDVPRNPTIGINLEQVSGFSEMSSKSKELKDAYAVSEDTLAAEACEQLILDTTLASGVYSTRPLLPFDPLQLSDHSNQPHPPKSDPPPLHFSYFKPQLKRSDPDPGMEGNWKKPSLESVGARMLLSEWKVGSDPQSYVWSNPYIEEEPQDDVPQSKDRHSSVHKARKTTHATPFSSSQASTGLPTSQPVRQISTIVEESPIPRSNFFVSASQPTQNIASRGRMGFTMPSSPAFGTSQILPGAFGGRPAAVVKKAKKRISGF